MGETVAMTPGKVVLRTPLARIIQYAPATDQVRPEPVLIVPAWIMKYYILDLSPQNSLVKYLLGQGYTVFMISWKNPGRGSRLSASTTIARSASWRRSTPSMRSCRTGTVHAVGYCLGGTLLAIAAAAMARDRDDRLAC